MVFERSGVCQLGAGGVEADLEALEFAVPAAVGGFGDPDGEVVDDLDQASALFRVDAEHGASNAGVLVVAECAVGTTTGANGGLVSGTASYANPDSENPLRHSLNVKGRNGLQ